MITKIISDKIFVGRVIKKHFGSLVNANSGKHEFADIFTFFFVPIIIASLFIWNGFLHSSGMVAAVITIFSIFVGLLMNVLLLAFDLVTKNKADSIKCEVLRELTANITYCILVSLVSIAFALGTQVQSCPIKLGSNWILYFLEANFIITILMVIKRTYLLFLVEAKPAEPEL